MNDITEEVYEQTAVSLFFHCVCTGTANVKETNDTADEAGKVFTLPIGATRWCHHGSMEPQMGVLFLAKTFHPDRFQDVDLRETTRQYYADFFGMTLDDATLDKIFSGRGMRESSPTLEME